MQTSFNIPTGITMDLLTRRINLEDANEIDLNGNSITIEII